MTASAERFKEAIGPLWSSSGASPEELATRFAACDDVKSLAAALREDTDLTTRVGYKVLAKQLLGEE